MNATTTLDPKRVKALRVLPPLGLARIGNCTATDAFADDYLVTTEVVGGTPTKLDGMPAQTVEDYRDDKFAIRRHAARFRVYATLDDDTVVEVTTADGIEIKWRVALANLKAGWYQFRQAMDLPDGIAKPAPRRNPRVSYAGGKRAALDICPQPISISGAAKKGAGYQFGDGKFCGSPVYLGEVRTDEAGRLLVLGGRGRSASYPPNTPLTTFANNDSWHDDIADGPVRASIKFADGTLVEAEPGYVSVTPPNFAPGLIGLVTMDDAVRETFIEQGWLDRPTGTSFTDDIWPIFKRLSDLQWVNQGFFLLNGHDGPLDVDSVDVVKKLRDTSAAGETWRKHIFNLFRREQDLLIPDKGRLPQIYGDAEGEITDQDGNILDPECLAVTPTQYDHLNRWASGAFTDDWKGPKPLPDFASLDGKEQVAQLEKAALHDCLGGPFHPGIELTWTMRIPYVWSKPYHLNILPGDDPARQDFGDTLTPATCIAKGGPHDGIAAGALTRFMGVPWQSDGASCNSAADYSPSYFLSVPTFWGARVPDQVLSHESAARTAANTTMGKNGQAMKHFARRSDWLRDIRGSGYYSRIAHMVDEWHDLGMVLPVEPPIPGLPVPVRAEQGRSSDFVAGDYTPGLVQALEGDPPQVRSALLSTEAEKQVAEPPSGRPRRRYRQGEI
jgi:hypothetical protein